MRFTPTVARYPFGTALVYFILALLAAPSAHADKLRITSNPSGAAVYINGVRVGVAPYERNVPGGYLRRTRTTLGSRLEHPMVARITLEGYAAKEIVLTEGPMNWVSMKGHNHGEYWLLKTENFDVQLQSVSQLFAGGAVDSVSRVTAGLEPELSLEELVCCGGFIRRRHRAETGMGWRRRVPHCLAETR